MRWLRKRQSPDSKAGNEPREDPIAAESDELLRSGFTGLRPMLLPRLFRSRLVPTEINPVARVLGANLTAVMVVRGVQGLTIVRQSHLRQWGVDAQEVWAVAMHNLRREPVEPIGTLPSHFPYGLVGGESLYTATQVLRLEELISAPAPNGALVVFPEDTLLAWLPIRGADFVMHLQPFIDFASRLTDPQSTSHVRWAEYPYVLWWTRESDGHPRLEGVNLTSDSSTVIDGESVPLYTITGSERFTAMANRLARQVPRRSDPDESR
jgi:hypothetical protein